MAFNEFFGNEDKPYAENLNDSLLLLDAFDVTVPVKMPDMFSNGEFASNLNLARKCGVGIITLISNTGVTIGTDTITGTGEVVFRVYPNFNSFYKWQSIILQKTGTVNIAFRKPDGSSISATVGSDGTISENNALKELSEIDMILTLTNATISSILINFINNHTKTDRVSALLEASQLANVNGSVATGNTEAVNGGTVKTALDNLHSTVTGEMEDLEDSITGETNTKLVLKEDKSNKVTVLDSNFSHYPSCTAVNTGLNLKEDKSNKVTTLDSNSSHYPSCTAVNTGLTLKEDKSNKVTTLDNNSSHYPTTSALQNVLKVIGQLTAQSLDIRYSDLMFSGGVMSGNIISNIIGVTCKFYNMNGNLVLTQNLTSSPQSFAVTVGSSGRYSPKVVITLPDTDIVVYTREF